MSTALNDSSIDALSKAMQASYERYRSEISLGHAAILVPKANKDRYLPIIGTLVSVLRALLDSQTCENLISELFTANRSDIENIIKDYMVEGTCPTPDTRYILSAANQYALTVFEDVQNKHTLMGYKEPYAYKMTNMD